MVLLSSQVLSEQSSLNLLREVKYESEEKVSVSLQSSLAHEAELASLVVPPVTTSPHSRLDTSEQAVAILTRQTCPLAAPPPALIRSLARGLRYWWSSMA